jgi:pentose-5-phosphate-3-epimerase
MDISCPTSPSVPDVIKAMRPHTKKVFDVHLMIAPCDPYLEAFAKAGCDHHHRACRSRAASAPLVADDPRARQEGRRLDQPGHAAERIEYVLDLIDLVLVMSVNPGFGGQAFIPRAIEKISDIRAMVAGRPIDIEVDGGVHARRCRSSPPPAPMPGRGLRGVQGRHHRGLQDQHRRDPPCRGRGTRRSVLPAARRQ